MLTCRGCGGEIPPTRAAQARYCGLSCRKKTNNRKCAEWQRSYNKAYRQRNADRLKKKRKDWLSRNAEYDRAWKRRHYFLTTYGDTAYVDDPLSNPYDRFRAARVQGYRSGLEVSIANQLKAAGVDFKYEAFKIPFAQPSKTRQYLPDCSLPNGIVIELKGRFITADRQKHLLIKEQYPDLDLRFVFSNPQTRISKQSKTTYAAWCESKGFKYAKCAIPGAWLAEPMNLASFTIIQRLTKK